MPDALKPVRCYVSLAGNNKIADWYDNLSAQERSDADEFIKDMRRTKDWMLPHYRPRLKANGTRFQGHRRGKRTRLMAFFV